MASSTSTVCLKLLIDTKRQRVLFAEAGKDFVDFLFTLLSLPVGTVIRLLKDDMAGSLGHLYGSVESLSNTYMQPYFDKDTLLKPKAETLGGGGANVLHMLTNVNESSTTDPKSFYYCSNCSYQRVYVTDDPKACCPNCRSSITSQATYVAPSAANKGETSGEGGYVKGVVTYMVMDNLEVKPMSTISSITILNTFNVKDVGALEEKVVHLGKEEGVKLLKESLLSKLVLTTVFLGSKAA